MGVHSESSNVCSRISVDAVPGSRVVPRFGAAGPGRGSKRRLVGRLGASGSGSRSRRVRLEDWLFHRSSNGEPLGLPIRDRRSSRKRDPTGAGDLVEATVRRPQPDLDESLGAGSSYVEEPLPRVISDALIEKAMGVGTIEQTARRVEDAEVEPRIRPRGSEKSPRLLDVVVRDLPVDEEAVGVDRKSSDARPTVPPRDGFRQRRMVRRWRGRVDGFIERELSSLKLGSTPSVLRDPRGNRGCRRRPLRPLSFRPGFSPAGCLRLRRCSLSDSERTLDTLDDFAFFQPSRPSSSEDIAESRGAGHVLRRSVSGNRGRREREHRESSGFSRSTRPLRDRASGLVGRARFSEFLVI